MATAEEKKEYQKAYYQKNKAKWRSYNDKWVSENPEKNQQAKAAYRDRNKASRKAYNQGWAKQNAGKVTAYARAYQLLRDSRMPKWLSNQDKQAIRSMYENRPAGYHVDHIVPLKGKLVSGLHVPWNLQYLPAVENVRKGNKF